MNYILLLLLILEIVFIYQLNGKNAVSPSLIACCVFTFSTIIFLLAKGYYEYELSLETVLVIPSMILCIFIGEIFAKITRLKVNRHKVEYDNAKQIDTLYAIYIPKYAVILLFLFVTAFSMTYFISVYKYSLTVGNASGNYETMTKYVRLSGTYSTSTIINQGVVASECIVYFSVYCFLYNLVLCKKKEVLYLLPVLGFVFQVLAYSGRSNIIRYLCVFGLIFFTIYKQSTNWKRGHNKKIIKVGVISILLMLVVFRLLGYRTDASINNALWDNIVEYTSSGLVGLDLFLISGRSNNILFAQNILKNVYVTLRDFGMNIPQFNVHDEFFLYNGGYSNIYTELKSYIEDFSLVGAYFSMFGWGVCITKFINSIINNGVNLVKCVVLGLFFYPVAMISIDSATPTVLSMTTLYMIVYLLILNAVFIKGGKNIRG